MISVYITLDIRAQVKAEVDFYQRTEGEERATMFEDQVTIVVNKLLANPYRVGSSVPKMPANHRRILIGNTHWWHYRINGKDDNLDVLVYWMRGKSEETRKMPASGLKRKATGAAQERAGSLTPALASGWQAAYNHRNRSARRRAT